MPWPMVSPLGGICWATSAVYNLGVVAEMRLSRFSWIGRTVAAARSSGGESH